MLFRIRHWFARRLCARSVHLYETTGSWAKCIRVHWTFAQADERGTDFLCYTERISSAYDHGKGRMWLS